MKAANFAKTDIPSKWLHRFYACLFAAMAFTGFGQMPIFKRYYLADIPGMAWTADFYFTHTLHYLGAGFLLALVAYFIGDFLLSRRKHFRLTPSAYFRVALLTGIVVTGIFRVLKNLPDVVFSPAFTLFIDLAHLGFMMIYLITALALVLSHGRWLAPRGMPNL